MRKFSSVFILSFFISLLASGNLFSQKAGKEKITLSSKIVDQEGNPVQNAVVYGNEGSRTARTDAEGNFTITVKTDNPLLVEADGYASKQVDIKDKTIPDLITIEKQPYQLSEKDKVNIPFGTIEHRYLTGAVTVLDPDEILKYDANQDIYAAMNGRVPGLFGNDDVYGMGSALLVVDGIPRPVNTLNLEEIQQITVLKDPVSRLLYGARAYQPVILFTTKRGEPYKSKMNVRVETGVMSPISYPKYLGAADYMTLYNEARVNDGKLPIYDSEAIDNTRNKVNPVLYPDESYYNSTYLKNFQSYFNLITEASGGNDIAQYYVYMGWNRQDSLLALGKSEKYDRINLRGNANYKINDYISMRADGVAIFELTNNMKNSDFYTNSSTFLPNQAPVLIPVSDSTLMANATLINGKYVLGGSSNYQDNIYGDMVLAGYTNTMNRILQVNSGLDFDLNFITEGLTAKAYLTFDVRNYYETRLLNKYAVYNPVPEGDGNYTLDKIGLDVKQGAESLINPNFYRRIGLFGTLNYHRIFNTDHEINGIAVAYRQQLQLNNQIHETRDLHFGLQANYSYKKKYIAQVGGVVVGSPRFSSQNRYAFSPAAGLAWVISDEDFMPSDVFNFLKLRVNWGIINTDQGIADYYLYQTTYSQGNNFIYDNGVVQNRVRYFGNIGNPDIGWVKREELSAGFDALILNKSVNLEATFFRSRLYDEITIRDNYYPVFVGDTIHRTNDIDNTLPYENYNSHLNQGVDFGITYHFRIQDFNLSVGSNLVYAVPKVLQLDEPDYEYDYLRRTGKPTDAIFGYVAEGLFSDDQDIASHPTQTFGVVQPGDIKYKDLNNDGIIDVNDMKVIGYSTPRLQYSLHFNISYKIVNLFVMGIGQNGQSTLFDSPYYWVYGERKYSELVMNRWTPETASTATYPRLSSVDNANNFRSSTYWLDQNNWFTLQRVQLSVNLPEKIAMNSFFKGAQIYLRGSNLLTLSKIREKRELNIGSAPQFRTYAVGLNASF